jgi:hypothetical protein
MMNRAWALPLAYLALGALLIVPGAPVLALDTHFAGFGTASLSCAQNNTADFIVNEQPTGPGRTRRCDAGLDSVIGLQLDVGLSKALDFGLQLVADRNPDRSYAPEVAVAQLRWRLDEATTLRFGRMPTASFLHEEDRKVRYAQPWVRPPQEVYGLVPAFSNDGLSLIRIGRLGHWRAEWHGGITTVQFDSPITNSHDLVSVKSRQVFLNLALQEGNTLIKLGYGLSRVSSQAPGIQALLTGLRLSGAAGTALAEDLVLDNSTAKLFTVGLRHEWDNWLAMGEFGYRTVAGYPRDQYGAYVTVGRRFGLWMPYATLARRWTHGPDSDSRAGFLALPVNTLLAASRYDSSSLSLGLSREIHQKATLKLQADWIKPSNNSWGIYTNHAPDYNYAHPDSNWLLTLSLDFVF